MFAFCLRAPVILGRQLRPFSSAHLMMLECINSPLVRDAGEVLPADLLAAIYICSFEYPFPWLNQAQGSLFKEIAEWGGKVQPQWDFQETLEQWLDYFRSYWKAPERTHSPDAAGVPVRAPASIKIVAWLLRTIHGMTETRAWNMSINLALAYKAGCDALDGDKSLLDDDAIAVLDAAEPEKNRT